MSDDVVSFTASLRSRLPTNRWLWALPWSPLLVCSGLLVLLVRGANPPVWWTILAVYGGLPASVLAHVGLLSLGDETDSWLVASVVGAAALVALVALYRPGILSTPATALGALVMAGNLTVTPVVVLTVVRWMRDGVVT